VPHITRIMANLGYEIVARGEILCLINTGNKGAMFRKEFPHCLPSISSRDILKAHTTMNLGCR
jgi:hypothetical protein